MGSRDKGVAYIDRPPKQTENWGPFQSVSPGMEDTPFGRYTRAVESITYFKNGLKHTFDGSPTQLFAQVLREGLALNSVITVWRGNHQIGTIEYRFQKPTRTNRITMVFKPPFKDYINAR